MTICFRLAAVGALSPVELSVIAARRSMGDIHPAYRGLPGCGLVPPYVDPAMYPASLAHTPTPSVRSLSDPRGKLNLVL